MTMIVFDGTHFWTDGRSSMRNRNLGKTMDLDHRQKLTLLHTPIVTSCGVKFTAIAGTGVSDDVKLIMEEVSRSAKAGETMQYMRARMEILLSSKTSCHVVGVGTREKDGVVGGVATSMFRSDDWKKSQFEWGTDDKGYVMVGATSEIPLDREAPWLKTGGDVIALASVIEDVGVGGVISRYNPITGKLDHPKPYSEKRQRALFDKWKEYKMKEFNDKVAHCNKVLDLRFPKVEEKK